MDSLEDLLFQPNTNAARPVGKFKPKPKSKPVSSFVKPCTSTAAAPPTDPTPPLSVTGLVGPTEAVTCIDKDGCLQRDQEPSAAAAVTVYSGSEAVDGTPHQVIIATGVLEPKDNAVLQYEKHITSPTILPDAIGSLSSSQNNQFQDSNNTVLPPIQSFVIETSTHLSMDSYPEFPAAQDLENQPKVSDSVVAFSEGNGNPQSGIECSRLEPVIFSCGLEALDDFLLQPTAPAARATGNFQPKPVAQTRNKKVVRLPSVLAEVVQPVPPPVDSQRLSPQLDILEKGSTQPSAPPSATVEPLVAMPCSRAQINSSPQLVITHEAADVMPDPHLEGVVTRANKETQIDHGSLGREVKIHNLEPAILSGLEALDGLLCQPSSTTFEGMSKFRPNHIARPNNKNNITIPSLLHETVQPVSPHVNSETLSPQIEGLEEITCSASVKASSVSPKNSAPMDLSPQLCMTQETVDLMDVPHVEEISSENRVSQMVYENQGTEVAITFPDLKSLEDILFHPAASTDRVVGKFLPKPMDQSRSKKNIALPSVISEVTESVSSQIEGLEEGSPHSIFQDSAPVEPSTSISCISAQTDPSLQFVMTQEVTEQINSPHSEVVVLAANGNLQTDLGSSAREEAATAISGLNSVDDILLQPASVTVRGAGKFRPKSKSRATTGKPVIPRILPDDMEPISSPKSTQCHPRTECLEEASADAFLDSATIDSTLKYPSSQLGSLEGDNHVEIPNLEAEIAAGDRDLQHVPGTSGRESASSEERKTQTVLETAVRKAHSRKVRGTSQGIQDDTPISTTIEDSEGGPSRRLRKRTSSNSSTDQIQDFQNGEDQPKQKRATRAAKRPLSETDKPVRRRKKVSEEPDPVNKEPPKKFSHSTRRNRRKVSKVLLETPEEEIDPKKLIVKDLIMFAELKERKLNKEAAAAKRSFPTRSTDNSFPNDTPNDDGDPSTSTQGLETGDDQADHRAQPSSKLNYHSFMNRTPAERWSKADTEMFYEAIRQFGTDFAMIQQLFPGRTRHQVKLKYKAEERKHPLQLYDALIHRSKDHSHFELVIGRLQAQAEQNSTRDEESPDGNSRNEEDAVGSEGNGEEVKDSENKTQVKTQEVKSDYEPEVESPVKSHESQDVYEWSQYRSEDVFFTEDAEKGDYSVF